MPSSPNLVESITTFQKMENQLGLRRHETVCNTQHPKLADQILFDQNEFSYSSIGKQKVNKDFDYICDEFMNPEAP